MSPLYLNTQIRTSELFIKCLSLFSDRKLKKGFQVFFSVTRDSNLNPKAFLKNCLLSFI